ncbi:hypothetical protein L917_06813, partial [Phytophthora nicotianae]
MDLRHQDSMYTICCQVVRYPHVKTLRLCLPKDALVSEVARLIEREFTSDYRDVQAPRTKALGLLKGRKYVWLGAMMKSRFPASICDFGFGFAQDLLREESRELNLKEKIVGQLQPATDEKGVIYLAALVDSLHA